jgi:hypothetical protein
MYAFQRRPDSDKYIGSEPQVCHSRILNYIGIDKRDGLVTIGKRLLQGEIFHNNFLGYIYHNTVDVNLGSLDLSWQKAIHDEDRIQRDNGHSTLAISAFMLSTLPSGLARKALVKEIWESGAHVMVSKFRRVLSMRYLLLLGGPYRP